MTAAAQPRFEGSYMGAAAKISAQAVMECKICWTPYDPAEGDDTRQVAPGTPFLALPDDWSCPTCGAPKEQFMVLDDPGSDTARIAEDLARRSAALVAEFTEIYHAKMRDVPLCNTALHVQAIGFRMHEGRPLGVLVAPWFMNLVQLPASGEDWSHLTPGAKEVQSFPSGEYEFLHNTRGALGGYKACSLFSPMADFASQRQAVEVAEAVMAALFDPDAMEETDRAADIRAAREAELAARAGEDAEAAARRKDEETAAAKAKILASSPSRRAVLTAGLAAAPETAAPDTAQPAESEG